jgi:magnesium-protoporphyrin O-methyltransferase
LKLARIIQPVPDCCSPKGYRWIFSERSARAEARRYRRRGLDSTSRRIVEFLLSQGLEGRSVLEVGGGVGSIQIELLRAGASHATSVELTPTYEAAARALLVERGLESKVERRVLDFAEAGGTVEPADIVILNRVLCCYPDMPKLAAAAADHARQVMVLSFPRRSWWTRLGVELTNIVFWLTRREFHIFIHAPASIIATSQDHGLKPALNRPGAFWTVLAMQRAGPA